MTFCEFVEVSKCKISSLKISFKSKYNSAYYFTEEGVYRYSNHWGRVGDCRWRLKSKNNQMKNQVYKVGYAKWTDFISFNVNERRFCVYADLTSKDVFIKQFYAVEDYEKDKLKTLDQAIKCSKSVHKILNEDTWAKHLNYDDIDNIRVYFIEKLILSNKTFTQIRLDYLKYHFNNFHTN